MIDEVFAEVHTSSDGISRLMPREDLRPSMQAVLRDGPADTERKTGLEPAVRTLSHASCSRGAFEVVRAA